MVFPSLLYLYQPVGCFRGGGTAHQDNHIAAVQFRVGAGGEDDRLSPPDGHDGAAGGLPELQGPDALADQGRVLEMCIRDSLTTVNSRCHTGQFIGSLAS